MWDDAAFLRRVKVAAKLRGLSLCQLAERAGVHPAWLSHEVTTGRRIDKLLAIASALDVDATTLFGLTSDGAAQQKTPAQEQIDRLTQFATVAVHLAVAVTRDPSSDPETIIEQLRDVMRWIPPPPPS
jgi:transcriptional regulator with XRE-family HTH domain